MAAGYRLGDFGLRIFHFLVLTLFTYVSGCAEADNEIAIAEKSEQPAEVVAAKQELSCESFEQNIAELIESSRNCNANAD